MVHDIFKTQVSIFYFGRTAGLFGNFNYEPNDDLEKSSNEVTERIDEFARSWEVSISGLKPGFPKFFFCGDHF